MENSERALDEAAQLLVESRHVVALVGAGLSAESGVPTFRGPGGLWTKLGEPGMNGYQEFLGDPVRWWRDQQDQQADPIARNFARPSSAPSPIPVTTLSPPSSAWAS